MRQVRYDIVDTGGTITLRHAGKLKHLGIGRAHARTEVICLVHGHEATVITHGGEVLAEFVIDPQKGLSKQKHLNPRFRGFRCP